MKIRRIEISNFRSIQYLDWIPSGGINCLIGPGDSGKSTILDAIDLCLGARRSVRLTDADFHDLNISNKISITLTLGELDDSLKNIEVYGLYLRGFNTETTEEEDEPDEAEGQLETVLKLNLSIGSDLESSWSLISERAAAQDKHRNLAWKDRVKIAPTRIGALSDFNLGWRHGSVLNRLTDEKPNASLSLLRAAREARNNFGDNDDNEELGEALSSVAEAAKELGISIGDEARALLDTQSLAFGNGTISLHDKKGVPLRNLGLGSTRLLIAGLQRKAAGLSTVVLVDELEHGLEPHRIIRFLGALGAKDDNSPLQVFMTTHSPIALRELNGDQLFIIRKQGEKHLALPVGVKDAEQGTLRTYPEAFLATSVLVCEGASEVGIIRGIDQYQVEKGHPSIYACGVVPIDVKGEKNLLERAHIFQKLGYRTAIFRDDDVPPDHAKEEQFKQDGQVIKWRPGKALEDELFLSLPLQCIHSLLDKLLNEILPNSNDLDEHAINDQLKTSRHKLSSLSIPVESCNLNTIYQFIKSGTLDREFRILLGKASRSNKKDKSWFKKFYIMEEIGRELIGPFLTSNETDPVFKANVEELLNWARFDRDGY